MLDVDMEEARKHLDYPEELEHEIATVLRLLHSCYEQDLPKAGMILINILKKKGVRLTDNSDTPLDGGSPL